MSRPQPDATHVTPQVLRGWRLPEPTGGKESRGSILVVGGSTETVGAVLLAAEAALRSGAGKLQVAVPSKVAPHVSISLPEALVRGLPSTEEGAIRASSAELVLDLAQRASAVLIGPGMADGEGTRGRAGARVAGAGGPGGRGGRGGEGGVGGGAAAGAGGPGGAGRARSRRRHRRSQLHAPPGGPRRPHAQPHRARHRVARGTRRPRRGPGRRCAGAGGQGA